MMELLPPGSIQTFWRPLTPSSLSPPSLFRHPQAHGAPRRQRRSPQRGPWRWPDLVHDPSANHISEDSVSADVSAVSPWLQLIASLRKLAVKPPKVVEPPACSHSKLYVTEKRRAPCFLSFAVSILHLLAVPSPGSTPHKAKHTHMNNHFKSTEDSVDCCLASLCLSVINM